LFRPGFWLDYVSPPYEDKPGAQALSIAESMPDGASMRVKIVGPDFDNPDINNNTTILLQLGPKADGETRFTKAGLNILQEDGKIVVDGLTWDSKHKQLDKLFTIGEVDNPVIVEIVQLNKERFAKELFYIPALGLLFLIIFLQRRRHVDFDDDRQAA
jgi:hypothetical protein